MAIKSDYRMPKTGEAWRHYKTGSLYTIVGTGRDPDGFVMVVYTEYRWSLNGRPNLYVQLVGRFLQEIDNGKPRFFFEREPGDDESCPFIRPALVGRL